MNMTQKIICIVRCDKTILPILDYIDVQSYVTLSLSQSVIIWVYKGLAMLIPPERIANMVRLVECYGKLTTKLVKCPPPNFIFDDTIKLPSQVAKALVGENG